MLSLVNVINHLNEIKFQDLIYLSFKVNFIGFQSVNVITFGVAQSDSIKRLLLYLKMYG